MGYVEIIDGSGYQARLQNDKITIEPTTDKCMSCNECGTYGSVHKSYDDDVSDMRCPKCDLQMSRIYSAPGLIFKGGGWGGNK